MLHPSSSSGSGKQKLGLTWVLLWHRKMMPRWLPINKQSASEATNDDEHREAMVMVICQTKS